MDNSTSPIFNTEQKCVLFCTVMTYLKWDLHGQVLVAAVYRGVFFEKLPEASPMSSGASARQLQDTATTDQG